MEIFLAALGKPRKVVNDNAKKFKFGNRNHVRQEFTAKYSPEGNGKVERIWSTIDARMRCIFKTDLCN